MILRYLNSHAFLSQLIRNEISLSPLNKLDDPTEGQLKSYSFFEKVVFGGRTKIKAEKERDLTIKEVNEDMLKYYVSCWTTQSTEDYALWNVFTDKLSGIIVISSIDRFLSSIADSNKIVHDKVKYVPRNRKTAVQSFTDIQERLFTKLDFYSYEHEYRFVIKDESELTNMQDYLKYLSIHADFSGLITKVVLSPFMSNMSKTYFRETINKLKPELTNRIVDSSIKLHR